MNSHSPSPCPQALGNHCFTFCVYGFAWFSISTLQLELLTSVLLILYYLLSLTCPIQLFVFQVYNLSWNLNMIKTQDPPTSLKEALKTEEHVKPY